MLDEQLIEYGTKLIERKTAFISQLNDIIFDIHSNLSGGIENIKLVYDPDVQIIDYKKYLKRIPATAKSSMEDGQ